MSQRKMRAFSDKCQFILIKIIYLSIFKMYTVVKFFELVYTQLITISTISGITTLPIKEQLDEGKRMPPSLYQTIIKHTPNATSSHISIKHKYLSYQTKESFYFPNKSHISRFFINLMIITRTLALIIINYIITNLIT